MTPVKPEEYKTAKSISNAKYLHEFLHLNNSKILFSQWKALVGSTFFVGLHLYL